MNSKKNIEKIKLLLKQKKSELQKKYKFSEIGVFGSYVKGEQKHSSDLDVLVKFNDSPGLFKFLEFENYLSDLLGIKVDLVMKDALKPRIGKRILEEVVML